MGVVFLCLFVYNTHKGIIMFTVRPITKADHSQLKVLLCGEDNDYELLLGHGIHIGAFYGDKLVGYTDIHYIEDGETIASYYLSVSNNETASWFSSTVMEEYRGHKLQQIMFNEAVKYLPKKVKYIEVYALPSNIPSVKNIIALGFKRIDTYNNVCRAIGIDLENESDGKLDFFIKELK